MRAKYMNTLSKYPLRMENKKQELSNWSITYGNIVKYYMPVHDTFVVMSIDRMLQALIRLNP